MHTTSTGLNAPKRHQIFALDFAVVEAFLYNTEKEQCDTVAGPLDMTKLEMSQYDTDAPALAPFTKSSISMQKGNNSHNTICGF